MPPPRGRRDLPGDLQPAALPQPGRAATLPGRRDLAGRGHLPGCVTCRAVVAAVARRRCAPTAPQMADREASASPSRPGAADCPSGAAAPPSLSPAPYLPGRSGHRRLDLARRVQRDRQPAPRRAHDGDGTGLRGAHHRPDVLLAEHPLDGRPRPACARSQRSKPSSSASSRSAMSSQAGVQITSVATSVSARPGIPSMTPMPHRVRPGSTPSTRIRSPSRSLTNTCSVVPTLPGAVAGRRDMPRRVAGQPAEPGASQPEPARQPAAGPASRSQRASHPWPPAGHIPSSLQFFSVRIEADVTGKSILVRS